jgi:hypothetical protein
MPRGSYPGPGSEVIDPEEALNPMPCWTVKAAEALVLLAIGLADSSCVLLFSVPPSLARESRLEWREKGKVVLPASVEFRSTPPGATVRVDGKNLGKTPLLASFPAGFNRKEEIEITYRPKEWPAP